MFPPVAGSNEASSISAYLKVLNLQNWSTFQRKDIPCADTSKYSFQYVSEQPLEGSGTFFARGSDSGVSRASIFKVTFTTEPQTVAVEDQEYVPESVEAVLDWDQDDGGAALVDRIASRIYMQPTMLEQRSASSALVSARPETAYRASVYVNTHGNDTPLYTGEVSKACKGILMGPMNQDRNGVETVGCTMRVEVTGDTLEEA